jgi:DNA (cytosine-5)-methyltransferase 1
MNELPHKPQLNIPVVNAQPFKILNLYSGIGGNRKLWTGNIEVTAVEKEQYIADIYKDFFPEDQVIVADAHQYLIDHFSEFDFIWASPPCPTHSQTNNFLHSQGVIRYPDMKLYQEIIFLQHFFKGKYCVENVVSYYDPLIKPQTSGRHYFWANFKIPKGITHVKIGRMGKLKAGQRGDDRHKLNGLGFDLSNYKGFQKEKLLRNCVTPEIGLSILESALSIFNESKVNQIGLFADAF